MTGYANNVSDTGTGADLGKSAVVLGSAAAGGARSLAPYGQDLSAFGGALSQGLGKLASSGTIVAQFGIAIDVVRGNLQAAPYDSVDYAIYNGLGYVAATGELTAGTTTAAAGVTAAAYYIQGGSKGMVQSALGCGSG